MISISSPTYDPNGALVLATRPINPYEASRRGNVTATLDGGVSVYDTGYSIADQTVRAQVKSPKKTALVALTYIVAHYAQIVFCCETGAFSAVPSFSMNGDTLSLQFRLVRRLDA
jgi:hypothetical protein